MKENGKMIRCMVKEKAHHKMKIFIKDHGKMICVQEKDFIDGQIKMNIHKIIKIGLRKIEILLSK